MGLHMVTVMRPGAHDGDILSSCEISLQAQRGSKESIANFRNENRVLIEKGSFPGLIPM